MLDNATISLIGHAAGVGVIAFSSAPSILHVGRKAGSTKQIPYEALYEDKDGVATDESESEYSVKWSKIIASIGVVLGVICSAAFSVLASLQHVKASVPGVTFAKDWATSFAWVLLCIQVLDLNLERRPIQRFTTALIGAISSLLLFAMLAVSLWFDEFPSEEAAGAYAGLSISQLALCLIIGVSFLSVPRRPDVFLETDKKLCERQRTVSWLSRLNFNWTTYLIDLAATKTLSLEDLPGMDALTRSKDCHDAFPKSNSKIWRRILVAHWPQFLMQWALVLVATAFSFAPRFSMLHLLRVLEQRGNASVFSDKEAWLWVLVLGVSNMVAIIIDTQLTWTMWSDIAIPVRAELGALVFSKAMKKKDCKDAPKEAEKVEEPAGPVANGHSNGDADGNAGKKTDSKKKEVPEKDSKKPVSEQGVINLIAVDATRVSQITAWQRYYFSIVFGVTFACAFLWMLVGWKSLFVGLATNILALPLNAYFAKVYSNAQTKLMEARDKKVGVVTEALTGIRQIKFSALEEKWEDRVNTVRALELAQLWRSFMADTIQRMAFTVGPVLLTAAALSTYVYINGTLTASVAFTALGVFTQLEMYLGLLPDMVTITLDAKISADRIDEFLNAEERIVNREKADSISFENVSVTFPSDDKDADKKERFKLRDINLQFPSNELSVISGKTGSGKTLLLNAILGEVDVLDGIIKVPTPPSLAERFDDKAVVNNWIISSAIAYVSQIPWIENATIKNNIIFGLPFDETRYNKVIEACALTKDLEMLEDGDATEVGAQGISLSGGQRWRLTFARALYSRAGILVLDDLFSALDAHVGKHIFENALTGELCKNRTRILVTHHVALCLPRTKYAVFLSDGTVERAGLIEELQSSGGLTEILKAEEEVVGAEEQLANDGDAASNAPVANGASIKSTETPKIKPKKLVEEEARETGGIKRKVYANYINATGGIPFWLVVVVGFIVAQALTVSRSFWIKEWTASYEQSTFNATDSITTRLHSYTYQEPLAMHPMVRPAAQVKAAGLPVSDGSDTLGFYLGIYVAISTVSVLISTARFLWLYIGSMRASRVLFAKLTKTILHMDLRWIDTTPLGRILNRFTADFSIVDAKLSHGIAQTAASSFQVLGVVAAGLFVSPYMIILALALLTICLRIGKKYLNAAREVKRLESICKSPIFEQFGSALKGVSTIRAFDNVEVYVNRMYSKIDAHSTAFWHISLFNRWMIFRMSMVGSVFSVAVAALVVYSQGISASLAGFALAFSLEFSQGLIFAIAFYASTELDMNAAERIIEYSNLETEEQSGIEVPAAWPAEGKLEVKDLVVGYAEGLPDILKGLSFSIDEHQRVGIVGRTGAGKSSVTLALFRFLKARSGTIHIDGIDISKIKLHDLRSRLAIIPQDPVLFSGTVRSNIDPFSQLEDFELKEALKRVHLVHSPESRDEVAESSAAAGDTNINIFESLSSNISEGGLNLSQGQRQLLCLARAIVSRPKIMVLDEATSAVDMATDQLIQRSIREEFTNTTLIVIAHRLSTISDFDKILVLDDGKAVEFGTPAELLEKKGVFFGMVGDSGEAEKIEEMIKEGTARVEVQ